MRRQATPHRRPSKYRLVVRYKTEVQEWTEKHEMKKGDVERMRDRLPFVLACRAFEVWYRDEKVIEWHRGTNSDFVA